MKCFNHAANDAVAICKSCGRGICRDCLIEVGTAMVCKERCESAVAGLNDLVSRNINAYKKASEVYRSVALFFGLLGLVMVVMGAVILRRSGNSAGWLAIILGVSLASMTWVYLR